MTGVKVPLGLTGAAGVAGAHVLHGTLPFTGLALGAYLAVGGGLVLSGVALRLLSRTTTNTR